MDHTHTRVLLIAIAAALVACHKAPPPGAYCPPTGWVLIVPPITMTPNGTIVVHPDSPRAQWSGTNTFDTAAACDAYRAYIVAVSAHELERSRDPACDIGQVADRPRIPGVNARTAGIRHDGGMAHVVARRVRSCRFCARIPDTHVVRFPPARPYASSRGIPAVRCAY